MALLCFTARDGLMVPYRCPRGMLALRERKEVSVPRMKCVKESHVWYMDQWFKTMLATETAFHTKFQAEDKYTVYVKAHTPTSILELLWLKWEGKGLYLVGTSPV